MGRMSPRPAPEHLRAWRALLVAHRRLVDRLAQELEEARQLPLTWYDVLVHLAEEPQRRLRMSDLAGRVLLSQSGLTRLVDRMADAGLVTRERCPTDRRGTFVVPTPRGLSTLEAAAPGHLAGVATHFAEHLDEREAALLGDVLERIAGALDAPA
jgi:DNA-binding MarR family transcriptional regulator